ncbi:glycosyltransferase [Dactylosporangium roseum]|uniref:Glycosyltransferase n=1 Tax=Dactylosporangium roseum TaxID=47989 RepID=A0ABY5YWZ4_9ACTN|nr:glycosyltransferase [Dactylosporangium roseum]UWZ34052.1 glycosyltransferase [Dactylosporangium roseum]
MTGVSIVVPTLGRPSLRALLAALGDAPSTVEIMVVDDRPDRAVALPVPPAVKVLTGRAAGPAAARNIGWRAARHEWVAFLDDDVLPSATWYADLLADLGPAPRGVGGVQGRVRVPLPPGRPTDWERVTAGLADGAWLTADMAYRRAALDAAGGFDERFPRAFREDAELAYRVRLAGWRLERGRRTVTHPARRESMWVSVRTQRGNADDALLRRLYGPGWRTLLEVPRGRRRRHALVAAAGALTAVALAGRSLTARRAPVAARRLGRTAAVAGAAWALGTAEFAAARIAPGPRSPGEVGRMVVTSVVIPPVAIAHWLRGRVRWRAARPWTGGAA